MRFKQYSNDIGRGYGYVRVKVSLTVKTEAVKLNPAHARYVPLKSYLLGCSLHEEKN